MSDDEITDPARPVEKPVDVLLRLASTARLLRSPDGRLHARVLVDDRLETYALKSAGFRHWLIKAFFAERRQPPSPWAIQRVVSVLEAEARFKIAAPSAFIRVGSEPDDGNPAYHLDLGDSTGRAIRISGEGWDVVDKPAVQFNRPDGLLALPTPVSGGLIGLLRPYVNVTNTDFQLLVAWLTAALRPVGPYPVLVLYGEQGAAKSTLARILRLLVDPQSCPLLALPRSTRDLMATALNGWLLSYDNISVLSPFLSNNLCQLVSGGGDSSRKLFSNDDRSVIYAQRPILLNGIEEFVHRGDLIDRSIILRLPVITPAMRRAEDDFWKAFYADYPRILGAVLDAVAGGIRELPSVFLAELPRMANFAKWGEAVGRGLGWSPGAFLSAYTANRKMATIPAVIDSPVAAVLLKLGPRLTGPKWQDQSAMTVLTRLTTYVQERAVDSCCDRSPTTVRRKIAEALARWPKDARQFGIELRRIAPQLRLHDISIEFHHDHQGRRLSIAYSGPAATHGRGPVAGS